VAWRRWLDRYGVAVGYAAGLGLATLLLQAQTAPVRARWLDWASTNLANAPDHPIGALVVSAFLTEGDVVGWLVLSLVALGCLGHVLGAWRTAVLVSAAHVIGTVLSEGIVAYRIGTGALPDAYRHIRDVGPSYVVVAALVAGIAYGRWPGRLLCAGGFVILAPSLFGGLFQLEVSAVGHVSAILVAVPLGGLLRRARLRDPAAQR
jgi:hypothetical protein